MEPQAHGCQPSRQAPGRDSERRPSVLLGLALWSGLTPVYPISLMNLDKERTWIAVPSGSPGSKEAQVSFPRE